MNIKKEILLRVRFAFVIILLVSTGIIYSIFDLQFNQSDRWEKKSENINFKYDIIQASRGNILSDDGSILATSLPFYKVAFDPSIPDDEMFDFGIDSLSYNLSLFFKDRSMNQYKKLIIEARDSGRRYLLLNRNKIGYQAKKKLSSWPIFREGILIGGVLFEMIDHRYRPFSKL